MRRRTILIGLLMVVAAPQAQATISPVANVSVEAGQSTSITVNVNSGAQAVVTAGASCATLSPSSAEGGPGAWSFRLTIDATSATPGSCTALLSETGFGVDSQASFTINVTAPTTTTTTPTTTFGESTSTSTSSTTVPQSTTTTMQVPAATTPPVPTTAPPATTTTIAVVIPGGGGGSDGGFPLSPWLPLGAGGALLVAAAWSARVLWNRRQNRPVEDPYSAALAFYGHPAPPEGAESEGVSDDDAVRISFPPWPRWIDKDRHQPMGGLEVHTFREDDPEAD